LAISSEDTGLLLAPSPCWGSASGSLRTLTVP
jgi:hypothetical protein